MSGWKTVHANEAAAFSKHRLVEDVLTEFAENMRFDRKGLPEYGLQKIVMYVAQVVLARARGFDPEMLVLNDSEFNEAQKRLAEMFLAAGKPVTFFDGRTVAHVDPEMDRA